MLPIGLLFFMAGAVVFICLITHVVDFLNIDTQSCYVFSGDNNE